MRWIFIGVVVLNLVFLGWSLADLDDAGTVAASTPATAKTYPTRLEFVSEGPQAGAVVGAPSSPVVSGCPAVGPFAEADGARVSAALKSAGFEVGSRLIEVKNAKVYWVYLPPFPDRQQAARKLRELQAKGVDSFLVAEGADANAISLGSFAKRDSALGVQSRLRSAGYGAEIREETRNIPQGWVVLMEPDAQGYLEHVPADLQGKLRQDRVECGLAR